MTCIVGIVDKDGSVWLGADSAGVAGLSIIIRKDPKIYEVGPFLIGFTSSFRFGQLLGYGFVPPKHHADVPVERYMVTQFIPEMRKVLKDGGYVRIENSVERGGICLVGYAGRLFKIESDFQVGESLCQFNATGCGEEFAMGALAISTASSDFTAEKHLEAALKVAEELSAGVRGPFLFKQTKPQSEVPA